MTIPAAVGADDLHRMAARCDEREEIANRALLLHRRLAGIVDDEQPILEGLLDEGSEQRGQIRRPILRRDGDGDPRVRL